MSLRVAVAGLGRVGSAFCEALWSRGANLVAVADPDEDSPAVRKAAAQGCAVYREGLELGTDRSIDLVFDLTGKPDFLLKLRQAMEEAGNRRTIIVPRTVALFIWHLMNQQPSPAARPTDSYGFNWTGATPGTGSRPAAAAVPNIMRAPRTEWCPDLPAPWIDGASFISPLASVIGDVTIGRNVFVAPAASIRGDEGRGIVIEEGANVQDGVIIHGLENSNRPDCRYVGPDGREYSVYIGRNVSLAHGAIVHGPAIVEDGAFVGFNSIILRSRVGRGVFIGHGAMVIGVTVADNKFVPTGTVIDTQEKADALTEKSPDNAGFAADVIHVNHQLVKGYRGAVSESSMAGVNPFGC